jgi:hypothetical protein
MVVMSCHWVDTRECEWVIQVEHDLAAAAATEHVSLLTSHGWTSLACLHASLLTNTTAATFTPTGNASEGPRWNSPQHPQPHPNHRREQLLMGWKQGATGRWGATMTDEEGEEDGETASSHITRAPTTRIVVWA